MKVKVMSCLISFSYSIGRPLFPTLERAYDFCLCVAQASTTHVGLITLCILLFAKTTLHFHLCDCAIMASPLLASSTSGGLAGDSADTSLITNTNNEAVTSNNIQGPLNELFHDVNVAIDNVDNELRTTTLEPPASDTNIINPWCVDLSSVT